MVNNNLSLIHPKNTDNLFTETQNWRGTFDAAPSSTLACIFFKSKLLKISLASGMPAGGTFITFVNIHMANDKFGTSISEQGYFSPPLL